MAISPELAAWRKSERARLIGVRLALPFEQRQAMGAQIDGFLRAGFPLLAGLTIGLCWPFQGEYDARTVADEFRARGARLALPSVVAKGQPLEFLEWWPGAPMESGVYDIPVPSGTNRVVPDALLIPVVGIGGRGDRLGYGGGFYDRTLAAISPRPLAIAVAHEVSRLPTTYPQDHDILMDFVVTDAGIEAAVPGGLEPITPSEAAQRAATLRAARVGETHS